MSRKNSIEKRFPWSFFGFLLGTISLIIAIGFFYLSTQEDVTDLRFHIDDEFPLVELREKFPDIQVLYNEEDILESQKEIKIIRVRLVNSGRTILQSHYAQELPFGLAFQHSKILAVSPISPTSGYLHDHLFKDDPSKEFEFGRLVFNKPIIERGSQISFKVYLLQVRGIQVTEITAIGKISGMETINVLPFDPNQERPSKPERSILETLGIGFASGYVGMLAVMLSGVLVIGYTAHRETNARKKRCREFVNKNADLSDDQKKIIESYGQGWRSYYLPTIRTLVASGEALDISELMTKLLDDAMPKLRGFYPLIIPYLGRIRRIQDMLPLRWEPSVFTVSDNRISINETNKDIILSFLQKCDEIEIEPADVTNR